MPRLDHPQFSDFGHSIVPFHHRLLKECYNGFADSVKAKRLRAGGACCRVAGMVKAIALQGLSASDVGKLAHKLARCGDVLSAHTLAIELKTSAEVIKEILDDPRFVTLVRYKVNNALHRDGLRLAVQLLNETVRDKKAPLQHRLRAAELILSRTAPPAKDVQEQGGGDISDMTTDQLRGLVEGMQREISERATPVNAPVSGQVVIDAQPIDANSCFD